MTASPRRPWLVLVGLALGVCVTNGFARFAYGLVLPAMKETQSWTYAQAGWLNTANALGYVFGAVLTLALIRRILPSRLFTIGVLATTACLLANGFAETLWAQSLWRVLAGVFGAMSFSTGGALAAALFRDNPRHNALAIALYFGFGGGLGIVLAGATVPIMLDVYGPTSWPWAWTLIGLISLAFCPLSVWASEHLRPPTSAAPPSAPVPIRRMLGELAGYASFGLGYIVYLTFLVAWMKERAVGAGLISVVWVILGTGIVLSPFVWRSVFARFASGVPLAMILTGVATGSILPIVLPGSFGLVLSASVLGLSVFMAPGAITSFIRQNLPQHSWGTAISQFTVVFAVSQTISPIAAGMLGDITGDIGDSLLVAAGVLLLGAALAFFQKPLRSQGRSS